MQLIITTMSSLKWRLLEYKDSWYFGYDLVFKEKFVYFRLFGIETTFSWW